MGTGHLALPNFLQSIDLSWLLRSGAILLEVNVIAPTMLLGLRYILNGGRRRPVRAWQWLLIILLSFQVGGTVPLVTFVLINSGKNSDLAAYLTSTLIAFIIYLILLISVMWLIRGQRKRAWDERAPVWLYL
jgi:hypothetical protein